MTPNHTAEEALRDVSRVTPLTSTLGVIETAATEDNRMKKTFSGNQVSSRRVPVLSPEEERILSQVIQWADEYAAVIASGDRRAYLQTLTTDKCSKYFRYGHGDMLVLLNRLEKQELIVKRRRQSAGPSGSGYDGSLHSEVVPTEWGREVLSRNR